MGVTTETRKNLILDAGAVWLNYGVGGERLLGATTGGNSFLVEREVREIEVDGVKGKVKGLRRIITENATLTVNLKEMSSDNLVLALAGSESDDPLIQTMYAEYLGEGTAGTDSFTAAENIIVGSETLYVDGEKAAWVRGVDYNIVGDSVETTSDTTINAGEHLSITYRYETAAVGDHDIITSDADIELADYVDNVALVANVSGSSDPIVCVVHNALADGNLELSLTDKDETVLEVAFAAHYDPAALTDPIYEIRYPKIV